MFISLIRSLNCPLNYFNFLNISNINSSYNPVYLQNNTKAKSANFWIIYLVEGKYLCCDVDKQLSENKLHIKDVRTNPSKSIEHVREL